MRLGLYAEEISSIQSRHVETLASYATAVTTLLPADTAHRRAGLAAKARGSDALSGVAGVVFGPREHALTLAWALDPVRSGLGLLDDLAAALGLPAVLGPVEVSHDARTVDARVFDVRVDASQWRLALALGEAPTNPPAQMKSALDDAFGAGASDAAHLVWLTQGGEVPGPGWTPLTWRTLDHLLARYEEVGTVAEYRRVLREQVFRELAPSAVRRNLDTADHRGLCALQEGRSSN